MSLTSDSCMSGSRFPREKKPKGNKSQKVVDHLVIHCDDAHCDKDDCMGCQPEPRKKCRVPRTKKKKKKKKKRRRRRRRKAPCGVVCAPCKEQKCPGRCIVRIPLKARLSGCTFRDYLFLTFPGYRSLEGGKLDEYIKTVGKWEGVLFLYLGAVHFLKNLATESNMMPP